MKKVLAMILALACLLSLAACSQREEQDAAPAQTDSSASSDAAASNETGVIKIGVVQPLSGSLAVVGEYSHYGIDLAVEEYNNAGGVKIGDKTYTIETIWEDGEGKPDITTNAYNKVIGQDKVLAIIGPDSSGPLLAAGPVATANKVPAIGTTSSNPDCTTVGGEYVFRACWIDSFQSVVCAKMAQEILNVSKIAVLYSNADDYSLGLANNFKTEFEAIGGEVVAFEAYAGVDVKDFKAQLSTIQASGAEAVFLPNQANELPLQIQQIREMMDIPILGEMSWDNPNIPELTGPEPLEGCYFISLFAADSTDPVAQAFTKAFREKYDTEPNTQAVMSYDAMKILITALQNCDAVDDPQAFRDAIAASDLDLPSGHLTYDENRNPQKAANVMVYKNGTPTYVTTISPN